jgi:hypothetical protein
MSGPLVHPRELARRITANIVVAPLLRAQSAGVRLVFGVPVSMFSTRNLKSNWLTWTGGAFSDEAGGLPTRSASAPAMTAEVAIDFAGEEFSATIGLDDPPAWQQKLFDGVSNSPCIERESVGFENHSGLARDPDSFGCSGDSYCQPRPASIATSRWFRTAASPTRPCSRARSNTMC